MYNFIGILAGCGILAAIAFWWSSRSDKSSDIRKAAHKITHTISKKKIEEVEEKEKIVVAEIDKKEKISSESKKKIKDIQKKAAKEISSILKEESIAKIDEEIDRTWDDL